MVVEVQPVLGPGEPMTLVLAATLAATLTSLAKTLLCSSLSELLDMLSESLPVVSLPLGDRGGRTIFLVIIVLLAI